jgi:hypothetical protein
MTPRGFRSTCAYPDGLPAWYQAFLEHCNQDLNIQDLFEQAVLFETA